MWRQTGCAIVVAVVSVACSGEMLPAGQQPEIRKAVIAKSQLPSRFGEGFLFEYRYAEAKPESLLIVLWEAGIPVVQAWFPQDNVCMDIRGPRFTVELASDDRRIEAFGFIKGSGRLACATKLVWFTISR